MKSIIVLAGGEGSGKSSILDRFHAEQKEKKSNRFVFSREPGGSPRAEEIRRYIFSEAGKKLPPDSQFHLFWAARWDHIFETLLPALDNDQVPFIDRFDCCTFSYQIFGEGHHDLRLLFNMLRERMLRVIPPPTYIWLNVDPVIGLMRKRNVEDRNHFDDKDIEFHKRVRTGYGEFMGIGRVIELDANLPQEEVWNNFKIALYRVAP